MRYVLCIATMLALFTGCRSVEPAADGVACQHSGRPDWFQATFCTGIPAADKFAEYWRNIFDGGNEITEKNFTEARKILDAALLEDNEDNARRIIQHDCIANDCMMMLFKSHADMAEVYDNPREVNAQAINGRRFAAICQANEERFLDWLPAFREWDRRNGDWSGAQWAVLFEKRSALQKLPEVWLGRRSEQNLAAEPLEKWRAAENFPVKFVQDFANQFKQNKNPLWLLQAIDKPEVPEGARIYMNLHAFPGRCKVFVNSVETVSFEDGLTRSFAVPLNFDSNGKCIVVFCIPEGQNDWTETVQHAPWPVWLSHDRP